MTQTTHHTAVRVFSADETRLSPGWTNEEVAAVFAGTRLDLAASPPAKDANLRATAVFGDIVIEVPAGMHVEVDGMSVFGAKASYVPSDAPIVHVHGTAVFGRIVVREKPQA